MKKSGLQLQQKQKTRLNRVAVIGIVTGTLFTVTFLISLFANMFTFQKESIAGNTFEYSNKINSTYAVIDGIMTVDGNFINNTGGEITGAGFITVNGNYNGSGKTFGLQPTYGINGNSTIPSAMPVELIRFEAKNINNEIKISWTTASERNNDYFTLERSKDGTNFTPFEIMRGNGNSNRISEYNLFDYNPDIGTTYYRLKQTDYDGTTVSAAISSINFLEKEQSDKAFEIKSICLNPCTSDYSLEFIAVHGNPIFLRMVNRSGQIVYTEQFQFEDGARSHTVNPGYLKKGIYVVQLIQGDETDALEFYVPAS